MPEKIIQRKCFVINTAYILIAAMLVLLTILSAAVLYPYLWYSRSYKFVWRFISKFPRLL